MLKGKVFVLFLCLLGMILCVVQVSAQEPAGIYVPEVVKEVARREIQIPAVGDRVVLKCDFHMHTVFSDGDVWPSVRVEEAWREGLDVIAITDHIENQPSKKFVGGDHNSSYEVAAPVAASKGIILVRGAEITRGQEGHYNAIFITDANALDQKDFFDAVRAAASQGAFIFWNHPFALRPQDQAPWCDVQDKLMAEQLLHGIEVFNGEEWYPQALAWAKEKGLTVLANTDIHGLVSEQYELVQRHRPMTLVFAQDRTEQALHNGLREGKTVAWFGEQLAGTEENLTALVRACLEWEVTPVEDGSRYRASIRNLSDIPFVLENPEHPGQGRVRIGPRASYSRVLKQRPSGDVLITNAIVGRGKSLLARLDSK